MHDDENIEVEPPRLSSWGTLALNLLTDYSAILALLVIGSGIVGVMAIPAIQQARETALREECKRNLKQMGLALHNYQVSYPALPAAEGPQPTGEPVTPPAP